MSSILVDTNILVYAIDEDSIFHTSSQTVISNPDYTLYTTSKNLSEFLVVLTRGVKVQVSSEEALSLLEDLIENFTVLYPSANSYQRFKTLIKKYKPNGLRIHDFEIMSIGLENGISRIATMNKDDFIKVEEIELIDF